MKILGYAGLIIIAFGCSTENENRTPVSFLVANHATQNLTNTKICVESSSTCREAELIEVDSSSRLIIDLPLSDGGFIFTGVLDSKPISRRFGYFTNGFSKINEYKIQIMSNDSVVIE